MRIKLLSSRKDYQFHTDFYILLSQYQTLLYPPAATHLNPLPHPTPAQFLSLLASLRHDKGRESSKILSTHKFKEKC